MEVKGTTKILGLIGDPVEHSISPILHNVISKKLHKNVIYVPFQVHEEDLKKAVDGLRALGCVGFNVTVPHKVNIMQYLNECDSKARELGAVNTVCINNGKLIGYNTDSLGFYRSLCMHSGNIQGKSILIIGAGGAARALGIFLAQQGIKSLYIMNRSIEKAVALVEEIKKIVDIDVKVVDTEDKCKIDIIIQATSVGMHPNIEQTPIDIGRMVSTLENIPDVYDIIYNPIETAFLKQARMLGCKTVNGFEMLMYQGILAYEKWMDILLEPKVIDEVIMEVKHKFYEGK